MVVNHNLPAMNANRQMGMNNAKISKSLEKLSSGLGINRASDNAAGLAISEKMRGQISGLNQATANAQDGISLTQTAEGALNETTSILQRMRELSVQSANGTYQNEVDRENIQKEITALKTEVDRIATSTHYNNIKLLDGSISGVASDGRTAGVAGASVAKNGVTYGDISKMTVTGTSAAPTVFNTVTRPNNTNTPPTEATIYNKAASSAATNIAALGGAVAGAVGALTFTMNGQPTGVIAAATQAGSLAYVNAMDGKQIQLDNLNVKFSKDVGKDDSAYDETTQTLTVGIKEIINNANGTVAAAGAGDATDTLVNTLVEASSKITNSSWTFAKTATAGQFTVTDAGTTHAAFAAIDVTYAATTKAAGVIDLTAVGAGDIKAGATISVDGKTYEFVNDAANAKDGNVAVTLGAGAAGSAATKIEAATAADLAEALFTAIQGQANYTDPTKNTSNLKITLVQQDAIETDYGPTTTGGTTTQSVIVVENLGKTADAEKIGYTTTNDEVTTKLSIDQTVKKGTTFKAGDKSYTFEADTSAVAAAAKVATEFGATNVAGTKDVTFAPTDGIRVDVTIKAPESASSTVLTLDAAKLNVGETISAGGKTFELVDKIGDKVTDGNIAVVKNAYVADNLQASIVANSDIKDVVSSGGKLTFKGDAKIETKTAIDPAKVSENAKLTFQIGANGTEDQRVALGVKDQSSAGLGVAAIDASTQTGANQAIAVIDDAINSVSGTRADLGALQNRMEHTINSLGVASENLTAAESRIRDVNMASEMMQFTKNQILSQASQAMLAQANTLPQGVLQLLQ